MVKNILTIIALIILSGFVSASAQAKTIHVKHGDTLWELSHQHKTTVAKIKEWNQLHTDLIQPGDVLTVSPEATYVVLSGDTLWAIAKAHHIQVSQLMQRNSLTSDLIHPGLKLIIPNNHSTSSTKIAQTERVALNNSPKKVVIASKPKTKVKANFATGAGSGKVITVTATAYTPSCSGCSGITATGVNVKSNPHAKVIAVDPRVIPLGTKVHIEGLGVYTAADTGGSIKGHRIDVLMASERAAIYFGRKQLKITILN